MTKISPAIRQHCLEQWIAKAVKSIRAQSFARGARQTILLAVRAMRGSDQRALSRGEGLRGRAAHSQRAFWSQWAFWRRSPRRQKIEPSSDPTKVADAVDAHKRARVSTLVALCITCGARVLKAILRAVLSPKD